MRGTLSNLTLKHCFLMLFGSVLLVVELGFYLVDTFGSMVSGKNPFTSGLSEGLYYFFAGLGTLGTLAMGAGVVLLGFQLLAVVKEKKALQAMAQRQDT